MTYSDPLFTTPGYQTIADPHDRHAPSATASEDTLSVRIYDTLSVDQVAEDAEGDTHILLGSHERTVHLIIPMRLEEFVSHINGMSDPRMSDPEAGG